MSTIFGIFNRNNKRVERSAIQTMENALSYWDSDDRGRWSEGSVVLGHRMLWNTPESKLEHLPRVIHPENQTVAITIDARLDNREELAEQLAMTDLPLEKITDSELILSAYQMWAEACPEYLLGDFVFVIWDENRRQLFCARDHIGIKPFYYHLSDALFVFSNDIRGLISFPEISNKYNDRSIAMFLGGDIGFYDERDTFYEEIQKLPAATSMTIAKDHVLQSTFWNIQEISNVHYETYEAYVEKLRELLYDAVKVRLRTIYPVATHLSGGVDSSAIAVLAARELEKRKQLLYAFNWIETPDGEHDPDWPEWGFANQITNLENIEQQNFSLTADFIADIYDTIDISKDDISYFWEEYRVRDKAENHKVRTFLSGWGGDELISYDGYAYLSGLFWQGHFIKAIKDISILYKGKKYKWLRTIKRSVKELIYPLFYRQMSGLYKEGKAKPDPFEFTQEDFSSFAKELSFPKTGFRPGAHNEQKALFTEGHILQRIENWSSSTFKKKLEYSYPLLDKRIVEFALAVPEEMYARKEGHQRYFFRNAISELIPKHIAWEKKFIESEYAKARIKLWDEALKVWMQKNEQIQDNENCYVDRSRIMKRVKTFFSNKQNNVEDNLGYSRIILSILLLNLKNKDC